MWGVVHTMGVFQILSVVLPVPIFAEKVRKKYYKNLNLISLVHQSRKFLEIEMKSGLIFPLKILICILDAKTCYHFMNFMKLQR
jgi:hypothetical protein